MAAITLLNFKTSSPKPRACSNSLVEATLSLTGRSKSSAKMLFSFTSTSVTASVPKAEAIPAMAIKKTIPIKIKATIVPNIDARKLFKKFIIVYLF